MTTEEEELTPEEKKRRVERVIRIFAQVTALKKRGKHQSPEYAELCLEGIRIAPSVWTECRFALFDAYMKNVVWRAQELQLTRKERNMIKTKFIENNAEPMIYRAVACGVMVKYGLSLGTAVTVSEMYTRKALEFANRSPPEDNGIVILYSEYTADGDDVTVEKYLAHFKKCYEINLKTICDVPLTEEERAKIEEVKNNGSGLYNSFNRLQGDETLKKRANAGGRCCDYCKKAPPTEGDSNCDFLQICSRCKMVFYCSEACQKKSWKRGHKQACRKKGQIEVGDDMLLIGLTSRPDLNNVLVNIVGPAEGRDGRWLVKLPNREDPISVAGKNLARIRPGHCVV